jgi:hypothetical protein
MKQVKAQDEMTIFINESVEDAVIAMEAFGSPFMKAIGHDFNQGWVNTADPMNFGQFDIRLVATASFAPKSDWTFAPADYGLYSPVTDPDEATAYTNSFVYTNSTEMPTIFGDPTDATITMTAEVPNSDPPARIKVQSDLTLHTLGEYEIRGAPMLMPQVNIGLVKGTQLMVRGLPPVDVPAYSDMEQLEATYFGFGILHDIKQWIPGLKVLPFSWSVYGTYSNADLTLNGPFLVNTDLPEYEPGGDAPANYDEQSMNFNTKGYSFGTIVSKKLPVITLFGGFDYASSTTELTFDGPYPFVAPDEDYINNGNLILGHTDRSFGFDTEQSQFGIMGGVRFKLWLMNLTVSGTYAPDGYSVASVAFGVGNFR